jgi:uncharacterized protein with HEPN domain
MSKAWQAYAMHVLDAIAKVRRIGLSGNIVKDEVLYDAALRNLQTLSEATQMSPDDMKDRYPAIPWREISGFRNILVHNYLGEIDPVAILGVINSQLQPLEVCVKALLANQSDFK